MPAGQPFTLLCQAAARPRLQGRADLHIHTTASDGGYTPAQVVELARRGGLAAIALTDHDTLAGIAPARTAARDGPMEIVAGVEISTLDQGKHLHLLGYFMRTDDPALAQALGRLQQERRERFREMIRRLRHCGVSVDEQEALAACGPAALGRRHLAEALVRQQRAASLREAFQRYLGDHGRVVVPKPGLPLALAIDLVRRAGGVAVLAHPSYDWNRHELARLQNLGLGGVEADYPGFRPRWRRQLRQWAAELGLAVTGGSDCHDHSRELGAGSVSAEELEALRPTSWRAR